jgi:hypothetical protein
MYFAGRGILEGGRKGRRGERRTVQTVDGCGLFYRRAYYLQFESKKT